MYMKNITIASVLMVVLFCTSCRNSTNMTPNAKTESLDSLQNGQSDGSDSIVAKKSGITAEMAYKGVNNYCHKEYDWSVAEDNPDIMYLTMGEETDSTYQVVFRSYTGAFVHFYVNKASGTTRMVEKVPNLNIEEESGTIDLFDYLEKQN